MKKINKAELLEDFRYWQRQQAQPAREGETLTAYERFKRFKPEEAQKIHSGYGPAMDLYLRTRCPQTFDANATLEDVRRWKMQVEDLREQALDLFPKLPRLCIDGYTLTKARNSKFLKRWLAKHHLKGQAVVARHSLNDGNALVLRFDPLAPELHEVLQCTVYNLPENLTYTAAPFEEHFNARPLLERFLEASESTYPGDEALKGFRQEMYRAISSHLTGMGLAPIRIPD